MFCYLRVKAQLKSAEQHMRYHRDTNGMLSLDHTDIGPNFAVPIDLKNFTLVNTFGQAWFEENRSLRTSFNPDIAYPFWVLTYWAEVLNACEAKAKWLRAESWLASTGKTTAEMTMKQTVLADYLSGDIVDAMLKLLSLRLTASGDQTKLITDTTFASFIRVLLPILNGKAIGPITSSGKNNLNKCGLWFQNTDHTHLYLVLYRPENHWTACSIDFERPCVRYGDSLRWKRPKDFFYGLQFWVKEHHGTEFQVTDDLPCASQTDGFNCPIIAVNTVAHNALGDPLWTYENAEAMRMRAFCDILNVAAARLRLARLGFPRLQLQSAQDRLAPVGLRLSRGLGTHRETEPGGLTTHRIRLTILVSTSISTPNLIEARKVLETVDSSIQAIFGYARKPAEVRAMAKPAQSRSS
ncbi:hypothetical protein C8J57DRAFT_1234424 [Mycena rebaudengoi]|nr:hypothetical protein C8J57DRAFT_1234424 [Mycena rebaudengoi]